MSKPALSPANNLAKNASDSTDNNTDKLTNTVSASKPTKFVLVGIFNTGLDFGLMYIFQLFLPLISANFLSTGISMVSSFILNKKWTFRNAGSNYLREVVLFFVFTAIGLWIIQNGCIWLIERIVPKDLFSSLFWFYPIFAKGLASIPSLTWNYLTYNRFVFTSDQK